MKSCPLCGSKLERKENQSEALKYKTSEGLIDIIVEGLSFLKCPSCGESFYNHEDCTLYDEQLKKCLQER